MSNETKKDFSEYDLADWNEFCRIHCTPLYRPTVGLNLPDAATGWYIRTIQSIEGFESLVISLDRLLEYEVVLKINKGCQCCGLKRTRVSKSWNKDLAIALLVAGLQDAGVIRVDAGKVIFS